MLILRKGGYSMVDKLLNDASYRSYWRGYEYFKEGRVKNIQRFDGHYIFCILISGCEVTM